MTGAALELSRAGLPLLRAARTPTDLVRGEVVVYLESYMGLGSSPADFSSCSGPLFASSGPHERRVY